MKACHIKKLRDTSKAVLKMGMLISINTYVKEKLKINVPGFYLKKLENKTANLTQRK